MSKKSEEDFNEWLESISFVDKDGEVVLPTLEKDTTSDPEGDRTGG